MEQNHFGKNGRKVVGAVFTNSCLDIFGDVLNNMDLDLDSSIL
jgi:hypothetical protein